MNSTHGLISRFGASLALACALVCAASFATYQAHAGVTVKRTDDQSVMVTTSKGREFYVDREYITVESPVDREKAMDALEARIDALDDLVDELEGADRAQARRAKAELENLLETLEENEDLPFNQKVYVSSMKMADDVIVGSVPTAETTIGID